MLYVFFFFRVKMLFLRNTSKFQGFQGFFKNIFWFLVFPCSMCWLQYLNLKEKTENQTKNHQSFKKPEQLQGLPPETEVMIQSSVQLALRETASIIARNTDSQAPPRKIAKKIVYEYKIFQMCCSKGSG